MEKNKNHQQVRKKDDQDLWLSKSLAFLLRHGAKDEGLQINEEGFVPISQVLAIPKLKKNSIIQETIEKLISDCPKRFEIKLKPDGITYIRALYGHSILLSENAKVDNKNNVPQSLNDAQCQELSYKSEIEGNKIEEIKLSDLPDWRARYGKVKKDLDNVIILDFEAVCDQDKTLLQEIIQISAIIFDQSNKEVVDKFLTYVKPTITTELSQYCTKITGVKQSQVEDAPILIDALKKLENFVLRYEMEKGNWSFLTKTSWDIRTCLGRECVKKKIEINELFKYFITLSTSFPFEEKDRGNHNFRTMLKNLNLAPVIENQNQNQKQKEQLDTEVILEIVRKLVEKGFYFSNHNINYLYVRGNGDIPNFSTFL